MIAEKDGFLRIDVRVIPHSSRCFLEWDGETLRIKLTSPPVEGKANSQLIELISKFFSIPKRNISIEGGSFSRNKRIKIEGMDKEAFLKAIENKSIKC